MKKYLTVFDGEGSELIITDTGLEKISTPFLYTESPFEGIYLETLSGLLFKPGTYHINSYNFIDLNEDIDEPLYPFVEALILFNQDPELGIEYTEKIRKQFGFPLSYDYIDMYLLSSMNSFSGGEVFLSWERITSYKNKPIILLNGYTVSLMYDTINFIEREAVTHEIDLFTINTSSFYPYDFYVIDNELYEFNYITKKHRKIDLKIKTFGKDNILRFRDTPVFIMTAPDELIQYIILGERKVKRVEHRLEEFTVRGESIVLKTNKGEIELKPYNYKLMLSKLVNNYYLSKFISENYESNDDYIKLTPDHIIPFRYNGEFNPLMITYIDLYRTLKTNYTKNYLYSVLTIEF